MPGSSVTAAKTACAPPSSSNARVTCACAMDESGWSSPGRLSSSAGSAADFDRGEQTWEAALLCRQSAEQFHQALPDGEGISLDKLREGVNDLVAGGGAAKIRIHAGLEAFIRHDKGDHFALIEGGGSGGQFLRIGAEEVVPINRKFRLIRRASAGQGGKRSVGEGKIRLNLRGVPLGFVLTFFFAG